MTYGPTSARLLQRRLPSLDASDCQDLDFGAALGASGGASSQVLILCIPNEDRDGNEFGTQRGWVLEAAALLAPFGGGVTVMPACEGGWWNASTGALVWEAPVRV